MASQTARIRQYSLIIAVCWSILLLGSYGWFWRLQADNTLDIARAEARGALDKDILYRRWATSHGGLYVPVSEHTPPNPYLSHVPERDITTPSGRRLTLVNPAYMNRQVFEMAGRDRNLVQGHITSLDPIRPENAPDGWEQGALRRLSTETAEVSEVQQLEGVPYMRLIRAFITEERCLKCHAAQGYKQGDIRGGISVAVPLSVYTASTSRLNRASAAGHGLIWLVGMTMIFSGRRVLCRSALQLQQSEERYRTVADHTSDWEYWIGPEGDVRYVSPSCQEVCGYSRDEFYDDPDLLRRVVHPQDRHLYDEHFQSGECDASGSHAVDFRILTRQGEVRWISHLCRAVYDSGGNRCGRRASNRDITERKRVEQALHDQTLQLEHEVAERQAAQETLQEQAVLLEEEIVERRQAVEAIRSSEERFSKIFHLAPLIITISHPEDGTILEVNDRFLELSGYQRQEVLGRTSVELGLVVPADRERFLEELRRGRRVTGMELGVQTKDGRRLLLTYFAEIINMDGQQRLLSMAMDMTEHHQLEEQLRHSQKLEAVGQLAGGVAHDFNNKLTVILGYAELIEIAGSSGSQLRGYLREISRAAEHSRDITRQLLAFSRREVTRPRPVDLNSILNDTRRTLSRLIGEDVLLNFSAEPQLWMVNIDPAQVDQIIMNMVINARDAMPEGGTLFITTSNACLGDGNCNRHLEAVPGDYVLLSIKDTGTGMDPETLRHIFEPFFTTKEQGKGTGLGLATVYGIVHQNGGFIDVSSTPGRGTDFRIFLPRLQQRPLEEESGTARTAPGSGRVLLVEDDEAVRTMTMAMLRQAGYQVLVAESPEKALELCADHQVVIDLVLTDVVMPGMSGKLLAERIQRMRPDLPVLYMSGYATDVISQRGLFNEQANFIQKPFDSATLNQKIQMVMTAFVADQPVGEASAP